MDTMEEKLDTHVEKTNEKLTYVETDMISMKNSVETVESELEENAKMEKELREEIKIITSEKNNINP